MRDSDSRGSAARPTLEPGRFGRRLLLGLAVGSLFACSTRGRDRYLPVDTSVDPYAAVRARADEYYRQGLDLYQQGEYRKALDTFQRAKQNDPNPRPEVEEMIRRTQEALAGGGLAPTAGPNRPAGAPTPGATPTGRTFVSRAYNYAIVYPDGWRADGASTRVGSTLLDVYAEEQGAANAMVFGFPPPDGASQDALVRQSLALRQKMGTPYKRLGVRSVDDAQAVLVTYSEQRPDGVWLAVRQAVFQRAGTCWVVAVAAPANDAARYGGILDQMLDGFRVGPAARG